MKNIITPTIIMSDDFFTTLELDKICRALAIVNAEVVSPSKTKGRFAIYCQLSSDLQLRPAVIGKFAGQDIQADNLIPKMSALVTHDEILCTAHIPDDQLASNELKSYGAGRFLGRILKKRDAVLRPYEVQPHEYESCIFGFGFSDGSDDWQDEIFIAAIRFAIGSMDRFVILADTLEEDPVIYNARMTAFTVLSKNPAC